MATNESSSPVEPASPLTRQVVVKRLVIWVAFISLIYLIRDFFFIAFMTFLFSYIALAIVDWVMKKVSPQRDRPGIRRLVTVGVFVLVPLILLVIGLFVLPELIGQCQRLAGWLSRINPETEVARVVESYVGPAEFRNQFGLPTDERYCKALDRFRETGDRDVAAYNEFPKLENWIEGGFAKQFTDSQRTRIRTQLLSQAPTEVELEQWYRQRAPTGADSDKSFAASPDHRWNQVRRDPVRLAAIRQEWLQDKVEAELAKVRASPEYQRQFHDYYEAQLANSPNSLPYTFAQFLALQQARRQGRAEFSQTLNKFASAGADTEAKTHADFQALKQHELFQKWWSSNSFAKMMRHHLETYDSSSITGRVENVLTSVLNIPLDLSTALLLSFFICIDFPRVQRAGRRLRDTWLRDVYDEIAPVLSNLAHLVGRSLRAQGMIAICNAVLMFIAMSVLGVEHPLLLGFAVFVLCLVPTLGMMIAWILIVVIALIQPGGGIALALKVTAAVVVVILLETFVFSPRILGRLMELHPVLIIAILPIAHYFFGVWGLILAIPVSVFVINDVILRKSTHELAGPAAHGRQL